MSLLPRQTLGICNRSRCEQLQILSGLNARCHICVPNYEIVFITTTTTTLAFKVKGKNNGYCLLLRGKLELEDL